MANITTENINTLAQLAASISDGDYIYIYKSGANTFARIEKSLFMQGSSQGSGGIDDETYALIKANVDIVNDKVNALINALANLAFSGNRPATTDLDWSGEETTELPVLTSPLKGTSVNIGTIASDGTSVSKTIAIKGSNLTKQLAISVSGTGMSVSPSVVTAANANAGTSVTVTYTNTASGAATASGTLTISSDEVTRTVSLSASKQAQGVTYRTVSGTLSHCFINGLPAQVEDGGTYSGTLSVDSGYDLPSTITVNGTHGTVSYDSSTGAISIPNITSNIVIVATATEQQVVPPTPTSGIVHQYGMTAGTDNNNRTCLVDQVGQFNLYTSTDISTIGSTAYYGNGRNKSGDINGNALNLPNETGDWTMRIEGYVPANNGGSIATPSTQIIIVFADAIYQANNYTGYANNHGQFQLQMGATASTSAVAYPRLRYYDGDSAQQQVELSSASIAVGEKKNVTFVYTNSDKTLKAYVGNVLAGTCVCTTNLVTRGIVVKKTTYSATDNPNAFQYDSIKFYNTALTTSEINDLEQ